METQATQPLRIRQLMPAGYLRILQTRTNCKQKATLNDVVLSESTGSKYWPAVEALARETNPSGFAQWQAAQVHVAA